MLCLPLNPHEEFSWPNPVLQVLLKFTSLLEAWFILTPKHMFSCSLTNSVTFMLHTHTKKPSHPKNKNKWRKGKQNQPHRGDTNVVSQLQTHWTAAWCGTNSTLISLPNFPLLIVWRFSDTLCLHQYSLRIGHRNKNKLWPLLCHLCTFPNLYVCCISKYVSFDTFK